MFECRGCHAVLPGRRNRVYCSLRCQRAYERTLLVQLWLATGIAYPASKKGHYVRTYLADQQGHRCAICGLPEEWNGQPLGLVLDHVDGDADHNARENLRMICPNCDSQLPTYKSRNRGNGRHLRRARYATGKSY